jgi:hypothetical protein
MPADEVKRKTLHTEHQASGRKRIGIDSITDAFWVIDPVTNLLVTANAGAMRAVASSTAISFLEGKEQAAAVRQMYQATGIQLNPSCHQQRGAIVRMDSEIGTDEWANFQDPRLRRARPDQLGCSWRITAPLAPSPVKILPTHAL